MQPVSPSAETANATRSDYRGDGGISHPPSTERVDRIEAVAPAPHPAWVMRTRTASVTPARATA